MTIYVVAKVRCPADGTPLCWGRHVLSPVYTGDSCKSG